MIESIQLVKNNKRIDVKFLKVHQHKVEIEHIQLDSNETTIEIVFEKSISKFRNHCYQWESIKANHISNWYSPKIIVLENGQYVQANQHIGIWEVNSQNKRKLYWRFNVKNGQPISKFDRNNKKEIFRALSYFQGFKALALLFPIEKGLETSTSKVPFSAIICFTDHCDFDSSENLKLQRLFFKKHDIKVTKGFFLNRYSKREGTASFQQEKREYMEWIKDGHELAYHSLSQSIKPIAASVTDFLGFKPPLKGINVWIDHGYQPYNISQFHNIKQLEESYGSELKDKDINVFWNYIDSGPALKGIINQVNPNQFTLRNYYNGIKHLRFTLRLSKLIKAIIFYYSNDSSNFGLYYKVANFLKSRKKKKSLKEYSQFIIASFNLIKIILPVIIFWNKKKDKIFPLAKYSPLIFEHNINNKRFFAFQTIELTELISGLNPENIDLLIKESGICIGHTYFSAPFNYHFGKMFQEENIIDNRVNENFTYLSKKIKSKEIWNPVLSDLINHLKKLKLGLYDCSESGILFFEGSKDLTIRDVY